MSDWCMVVVLGFRTSSMQGTECASEASDSTAWQWRRKTVILRQAQADCGEAAWLTGTAHGDFQTIVMSTTCQNPGARPSPLTLFILETSRPFSFLSVLPEYINTRIVALLISRGQHRLNSHWAQVALIFHQLDSKRNNGRTSDVFI